MTRLQQTLLAVAAALAAVLFARAAFGTLLTAVAVVPPLLEAVPAWAWWTLFGVSMSFLCPTKAAWLRGRCGASCAAARDAARVASVSTPETAPHA